MRKAQWRAGVALATTALLLGAAACGGGSSGGGGGNNAGGGNDKIIIWGSTDKPVTYDPAGAYDLPSWNVIYNVYQTLVRLDPATEQTVPDAAESCNPSKDFKTWTCKLKAGQKFSNGDPLTATDVKFSFDRVLKINDPSGPASLLAKVKTEAVDDSTVVFHLASPNTLWNFIISTGAGAIVDSKVFPPTKKLADDKIIGSGPYTLTSYQTNQVAQFKPNPNYSGDIELNNGGLAIQYYQDESALKLDVEQGKVDIVYPGLSPTAMDEFQGKSDVTVTKGPGGAIRYTVFNLKTMPGDNDAQKLAIRRAFAFVLDRQALADNVYQGTVDPLYSMIAPGLPGQEDVYKTEFGEGGDKGKAKAELDKAGVKTPVDLQIWYVGDDHYGSLSADEYTEIKRQLEASGLFKVDLKSTAWEQYTTNCLTDKCPIYQLGWFPDYPDADDYVAQFYGTTSFLNNHYTNAKVDQLLKVEQGTTDQAKREDAFKQIQETSVAAAPVVPTWVGAQFAITHGDVSGVADTLKPDYIFRFWVLGKS